MHPARRPRWVCPTRLRQGVVDKQDDDHDDEKDGQGWRQAFKTLAPCEAAHGRAEALPDHREANNKAAVNNRRKRTG